MPVDQLSLAPLILLLSPESNPVPVDQLSLAPLIFAFDLREPTTYFARRKTKARRAGERAEFFKRTAKCRRQK
jgi:hypothetical protein